ncbi:MAG TPA: tetratricopeptide repeat protein [Bdellovibrionota bacterium]|nr:tetratricopeptide repeat protein [Bdellovibrionota bacterium]
MSEARKVDARTLFAKAYEYQMQGQLDEAVAMYKRSIELDPTAEAHTFLGWAYSFLGRYEEAIAECKRAIAIDPEFGNPWNDIGAYLIEMGRDDEAIPYLERATQARRYESPCFPHFNLSRIYTKKGMLHKAGDELKKALVANPEYTVAQEALDNLETQLQ